MKTFEEIKAMYMALGESEKIATRHAHAAVRMQNSEALLDSYRRGSQIKQRESRKAYNNLH